MNWVIDTEILSQERRIFIEGFYEADYVDLHSYRCKVLEPVKVKIVAVVAKEGIAVGGYVKTTIEHPCDRCLKPVHLAINGTIEALYKPIDEAPEEREEELQSLRNVIYYSSGRIDLTDRILEAIVMDVPMRVLCNENCKGLCPRCGADLNENTDHSCEEQSIDPRLGKLLILKKSIHKEG
ncbi:MAG TPA: DUF177 domain-containing protein [Pseudothermotoga sp.]|nr:MAG: Uncharacterized protein XD56_1681 [Pseudothermotoga lettingae]HBT25559.1 DUF177 domain-containing protein [Pseudothermotoga sp.]